MDPSPAPLARAPRVAVIVPAYGVAHLVGEALRSLRAQTLGEWECGVIDDGAPDDVAGAVAPYLADPRIRFLATDNRGVGAARNRAIAATSAPYLTLLDGDDLLRPRYLDRCVAALDADPEARSPLATRACSARSRASGCASMPGRARGDGVTGSLGDVLDRSFNVYIGSTFRRADWDRGRRVRRDDDPLRGLRLLGPPALGSAATRSTRQGARRIPRAARRRLRPARPR